MCMKACYTTTTACPADSAGAGLWSRLTSTPSHFLSQTPFTSHREGAAAEKQQAKAEQQGEFHQQAAHTTQAARIVLDLVHWLKSPALTPPTQQLLLLVCLVRGRDASSALASPRL